MRALDVTRLVIAAAAALAAGGCAAEDPWLRPRGPVRNLLLADDAGFTVAQSEAVDAGHAAPSAPRPRTASAPVAPMPRASVASQPVRGGAVASIPIGAGSGEIAGLDRAEKQLWLRIRELSEAHDRAVALSSALMVLSSQPSAHHREQAETALAAYKESPAVKKFTAVALGLSLAACSSINREIRALNEEERELAQQISVLQEARKANIALVSALQQYQRDGSSKSEATVDKLRTSYERAMDKVP